MTYLPFPRARRALAAALAAWSAACAAQDAPAAPQAVRFADYLQAVEAHSLDLQAQQTTIAAARAGVGMAGLLPDPALTLGHSREQISSGAPRPASREAGLSWEIETGGKRAARVRAARSGVRLAEAQVEGFRHALYSEAAGAFAEACRTREAWARKRQTLAALGEVVRANEARRKAGDVGGVELLQSRVEHDQFESEVALADAEVQAAQAALSVPLGRAFAGLWGAAPLECDFAPYAQEGDLPALLPEALRVRDDVQTAEALLANARDKAALAQANRWVNPTLSVGVARTRGYGAGTDAAGEPLYDAAAPSRVLAVSVSVPLPLSRLDRGELVQAEAEVTQALLGVEQTRQRAEAEVRAAWFRFQAARGNVARYRGGVLADAQRVTESMRLSYRHGAASLLELLAAQRSADEAYLAYLQARADLAAATVQLQLSLGQRPRL
ncbi:MAG: TolC family protein [Alicycliphilus denitrificans]|nr:TolC family protein [Alicycliphilus denitrificans]OJW85687.1 MAG: transporter [Alicycliphilus sp. 69-12]